MSKLSAQTQAKIRELAGRFPVRRSAVLPALHVAQAELGWLDDDALREVAQLLEVPHNMTAEVVGFYTMFDREKRGKYKLEVCRNLSCALLGAKQLVQHLEQKLGIRVGETTPDGKFTLLEAECLGACGYAPMMMIGPYFYENLTRETTDAIVNALAANRQPPVLPAGYHEKDGVKPLPADKTIIPTASEEIRDRLALGAAGKGNNA